MSKKNLLIRMVIMLVLIALMLPAFTMRLSNESKNNDVVFALNYNNAAMVLSEEEFSQTLEENKKMGVKTLVVAEESVNSIINAGYITGIRYNVLAHKYDDESEAILKQFAGDKKIHNDSYVLISKRPEAKKYLETWIPAKYTEKEYVKKETPLGADVYILYGGISDAWKVTTGFDEVKIKAAHDNGFDLVLTMMLGAFSNTEYIEHIERIIDTYNVKYINLKEDSNNTDKSGKAKKNYEKIIKLIKEKDLYLVVTENSDQLSNQKPIGYNEIVKAAGGKVLRSYETVDFNMPPLVETRYHQILNSVVDRNIRLVVINQLVSGTTSFKDKSDKTNEATKKVMQKLSSIGYNTGEYDTVYDYNVNRRCVNAAAMVLMVIMGLTLLELLFGKKFKKLEIIAYIGAVLSIPFTFKAPEGVILLYPTLFAAIAPCFAFTLTMAFAKWTKEKLPFVWLLVSTVLVALVTLSLCGIVQSSLLSGLDYYINSLIFRGIKISLIFPILYSMVAYGIMFGSGEENIVVKTVDILNREIKVYWMIIAALLGGVAAIYLVRSGNVTKISAVESLMRKTITEIMQARPRTKEFLVGWPALMLFVYYLKNTKITILSWCFSVGSSILFASVINSFCHVFTSAQIIYSRVINALLVSIVVGAVFLVANAVVLKIAEYIREKYISTPKGE